MNFFDLISNIGVRPEQSEGLRRRIMVSNRLAMLLLVLASFYVIFTLAKGLGTFIIPLAGLPFCFFVLLFNYLGYQQLARVTVSLIPMLVATLYHAAVMQPDEDPVIASYIFSVGYFVIPFVLFDFDELGKLMFTLACSATMLLSVRYLNKYVDVVMDSSYARTPLYESIVISFTCIIITAILLILLYTNKAAERNNQKLLDEMESQNRSLLSSKQELQNYIEQVNRNKKRDEERSWEAEMLAKFALLLRTFDHNLELLCDELLKDLVKSLEAAQGAIYLIGTQETAPSTSLAHTHTDEEGDTQFLRGVSCYAHDRKRFFERTILLGEGLVGQSFSEKEILYITEIPTDYFEIASGLGQSKPTSLLVVPLIANQRAVGVLEIASFFEMEAFQRDFIEKLAENIASAIYNLTNNVQMQVLLEEVQQLNRTYRKREKEQQTKIHLLEEERAMLAQKELDYLKRIKELKAG